MILILSTTLAGCGGGTADTKSNKQELNLAVDVPIYTIDVSKADGFGKTGNIFEGLYRLGKKGRVTPGLACKSEVSKDGKTYKFTIRKNAKFSDGSKITAQDFVYSWKRTITPATKSQYAYLFSGINNADEISQGHMKPDQLGVEAKGKREFVVHLNRPINYFKLLMCYPLFSPISHRAVEKYGRQYATKGQYMVYTGPFKLVNWTGTGDKWRFVKNNQYWDKRAVHLKKINFQIIKNDQTSLSLYESKKLDMVKLSNAQVKNFKNSKDYVPEPFAMTMYLAYNLKAPSSMNRKAMQNVNIRRAISLAINRKQLVTKVIGDESVPAKGLDATHFAYNPQTGEDFAKEAYLKGTVDYDKESAKKYWNVGMKQLGIKHLTVELLSNNEGQAKPISEFLGYQLAKVLPGLKVNLVNIPYQAALDRAKQGQFDLYFSNWGADFNDPISYLQSVTSASGYNYGKWENAAYNRLVSKAQDQDANDVNKRWQDMVHSEQLVMREQGVAPLYETVFSYLKNPKVKGIVHNTAGTQWDYKYVYIKH